MTRSPSLALWVLAAALLVAACGSDGRNDPILRLSALEALEEGRNLMEQKKYRLARKYLIHSFEVEPNSPAGRDGLLLAADALYLIGGFDSYVEAETRYRDFLNRFPTSDKADYAQFRVASSLAKRMEKPNRDQETTRKALAEFQDLLRLYPTSPYVDEGREELKLVRQNLAEHEFVVARFYYRFSRERSSVLAAALERLEGMFENYPDYQELDKIQLYLCLAADKATLWERASEECAKLRNEYPESAYLKKIPKGVDERAKLQAEARAKAEAERKAQADEDPEGEDNSSSEDKEGD